MNTNHYKDVSGIGFLYLLLMILGAMFNAPVQAIPITGSMGITGSFTASGGTDLSDASTIDLLSATGTSGTDDIGSTVGFGTIGTVNNGSINFNPSTAVYHLLTIGGWPIALGTTWIADQTVEILTLAGSGMISGNGFDQTITSWTLSANNSGRSYSLTVAVATAPGVALIFITGVGLIGLRRLSSQKS